DTKTGGSMSALVTYHRLESIVTITMDDGKMNALSPDMFAQLAEAFDRAEADRSSIVLSGREGAFSGGFDLRVLRGGGPMAYRMAGRGSERAERLRAFPAPVVAACPGHAIGMGAFLLLAPDSRVGPAGEYRIGANEVAIGITMPFFGIEICRQ